MIFLYDNTENQLLLDGKIESLTHQVESQIMRFSPHTNMSSDSLALHASVIFRAWPISAARAVGLDMLIIIGRCALAAF
jgi:hypothetical protein